MFLKKDRIKSIIQESVVNRKKKIYNRKVLKELWREEILKIHEFKI